MNLLLKSRWFSERATVGEMFVDGDKFCFALEGVSQQGHQRRATDAIPRGTYPIRLSECRQRRTLTPELLNVPGRTEIRIVLAHYAEGLRGSIAVGESHTRDELLRSNMAFLRLRSTISDALKRGEPVAIEIVNERMLAGQLVNPLIGE